MKEQEYIDLSDLVRLETIKHLLREITPSNSDVIYKADHVMVYNFITSWINKIRLENIKIEE